MGAAFSVYKNLLNLKKKQRINLIIKQNQITVKRRATPPVSSLPMIRMEVAPMPLSIGSDSDGSNYWSSDDAVSFYMPEYGLTYTLDPTWIGISNIVEQDKGLLVCPVLMTDGSPRGYKMLDSYRGFKIIPWTDEYIEQSDFFLLYSQKFAIEPRKRTDAYSQGESKEAME